MLCRCTRNDLADRSGTGVEDVVEFELEQGGGLRDGAVDADEGRWVEVLREEVGDERGDVRGLLGGLRASGASVRRTVEAGESGKRTLTSAVQPAEIAPRSGTRRRVIGSASTSSVSSRIQPRAIEAHAQFHVPMTSVTPLGSE